MAYFLDCVRNHRLPTELQIDEEGLRNGPGKGVNVYLIASPDGAVAYPGLASNTLWDRAIKHKIRAPSQPTSETLSGTSGTHSGFPPGTEAGTSKKT